MTEGAFGAEPLDAWPADLRAATMLREAAYLSFDAATENALVATAAEINMSRLDLIQMALSDWLESRSKSRAAASE